MTKRNPTSRNSDKVASNSLCSLSFGELVDHSEELRKLREEYADCSAAERRAAAQWALECAHAEPIAAQLFRQQTSSEESIWNDTAKSLAIDPEYADAMLAVGSLEYRFGRHQEGVHWFLNLTRLPEETDDLMEIIDAAGDFLIDETDIDHAGQLYAAAVLAFPHVSDFHVGLGYCESKAGRFDESIVHHRRAVELAPENYSHLNDLGFCLLLAARYDEAEEVLKRAVQLAPADYELAKNNLDYLRKTREEVK